jgi:hypothetical protein
LLPSPWPLNRRSCGAAAASLTGLHYPDAVIRKSLDDHFRADAVDVANTNANDWFVHNRNICKEKQSRRIDIQILDIGIVDITGRMVLCGWLQQQKGKLGPGSSPSFSALKIRNTTEGV